MGKSTRLVGAATASITAVALLMGVGSASAAGPPPSPDSCGDQGCVGPVNAIQVITGLMGKQDDTSIVFGKLDDVLQRLFSVLDKSS
jgi:hypothetical protein